MTHETVAQFARLRSLLMSIEDPAWLVHPEGKILIRNDAAAAETTVPRWIVDYVGGKSTELPIGARVRRIQVDGRTRLLAFGRPSPTSIRHELEELGLDDVHAETAEHLVRGFSDIEISLLIGRPMGVVHTYIVQVHRLLGVRTRVELIDLVRRARRATDIPPPNRARETIEARPSAIFALQGVGERRAKAR